MTKMPRLREVIMRAGFEIVFRNQPSYRPRITRIEVSAHAERIAALGRTGAAIQCPASTHRTSQFNRTGPVDPRASPATATHTASLERFLTPGGLIESAIRKPFMTPDEKRKAYYKLPSAKRKELAEMDAFNAFVSASGLRSEEHTSELQSLRHLVC